MLDPQETEKQCSALQGALTMAFGQENAKFRCQDRDDPDGPGYLMDSGLPLTSFMVLPAANGYHDFDVTVRSRDGHRNDLALSQQINDKIRELYPEARPLIDIRGPCIF